MRLQTFFGIWPLKLGYCHDKLPLETLPAPALDCTNGDRFPGVDIEVAKEDQWSGSDDGDEDLAQLSAEQLVQRLTQCGYKAGLVHPADTLVINGFDRDLLTTVALHVLGEDPHELGEAAQLLQRTIGAAKTILAVPAPAAETAGLVPGVDVCVLPSQYPNGHPEVLARTVAGKLRTKGSMVILPAEQLLAMARSLKTRRPMTEKLVTFVGRDEKPAKLLKVRVGTPVSKVLEFMNIELQPGERLILGGPLAGEATYDPAFPITESTDSVMLQAPDKTANISDSQCIHCGKCVEVCPNKLPVNLLGRYAEYGIFDKCAELEVERCIECGLCAYVCTARRPMVQFMQFAKSELAQTAQNESED
jgi:Na+-translocating ferredoxin:NAD+ oxidoreductase subunit C